MRVDGPLDVSLVVGGSPRASASAADARALDQVVVEPRGGTLVVRLAGGARASAVPIAVALSTPALVGATLTGGGRLAVTGWRGDRVEVASTGGGTLTAAGIDAADVVATQSSLGMGAGTLTLAGRARRARLLNNGAGTLDADALAVDELSVAQRDTGAVRARARLTAEVVGDGIGRVEVAGRPRCAVRVPKAETVRCGTR